MTLHLYTLRIWSMDAVRPAHVGHLSAGGRIGLGEGMGEGVATALGDAGDASEGRTAMTSDDVREKCIEMINQLLDQEFQRPIFFSAIAIDGLTIVGSSETVTGTALPLVATSGPFTLHLVPIHVLFVNPQGKVAHGVIAGPGAVVCHILP